MARQRAQRIKSGDVQVEGLGALQRALKDLGKEFPPQLRKVNKGVAGFVAGDARSAAMTIGGVAAHVAPTIKASAGVKSAGVALGSDAHPEAGGAEFGALKYKQFRPWRGNSSQAGYFLYPTIRRDAERIETEYTRGIDELLTRLGLAK